MEKVYSLPSYTRCHCQSDCFKFGQNENEPCWGEVVAIDEVCYEADGEDDSYWIHSCQGHINMYESNEEYELEKK